MSEQFYYIIKLFIFGVFYDIIKLGKRRLNFMIIEDYSNGGKALGDLVDALRDSGTSNEMTPEQISNHQDTDTQNGETIRYTQTD